MFIGKSAAKTFFARFFEKEKVQNEEPQLLQQRKRSQSLFAPNAASLLSGDHVGGYRGESSSIGGEPFNSSMHMSSELTDTKNAVNLDHESNKPETNEKNSLTDSEKADEDEDLQYLRLNCDRLKERRATDFSQVSPSI